MKRILVPVDLSKDSWRNLQVAQKLALENDASLVLLHVVQLNIQGEERGIPRGRLLDELLHNAETRLKNLADSIDGNVNTQVLVVEGQPASVIAETAASLQADVIVLHANRHPVWLGWFHVNRAMTVAMERFFTFFLHFRRHP